MAVMKTSPNRGRRGRPPNAEKSQSWTIRIPESISAPWDLILHDPQLGRSKIGLRQFIISELMRLLLEAWQQGKGEINVSHILVRVSKELSSLEQLEGE